MPPPAPAATHLRIAVDIGGTFTDLAAFDEQSGKLTFGKALSTPEALVDGIRHSLDGAGVAVAEAYLFLHGTTIGINTLLERTGAQTALLITRGFRDIYEIGRINRPDAYNLFFGKHEPLVRRSWRFEVNERMKADGSVHEKLDEDEGSRAGARVEGSAAPRPSRSCCCIPTAIPSHERRVEEIVREEIPAAFVSSSHALSQEYREFERASTVAANAYIGPRVESYLGQIDEHLREHRFAGDFYVVQSTGGLFPVERGAARLRPHARIRTGRRRDRRAGDLRAARPWRRHRLRHGRHDGQGRRHQRRAPAHLGQRADRRLRARAADSDSDDGYFRGRHRRRQHRAGDGRAMRLRVGPQSAGSMPGPACYGKGGREPTVTDANLVLGRLDRRSFPRRRDEARP